MSSTRIGIIVVGLAAILVLGTWGWLAAIDAVNNTTKFRPVLEALAVYGIAFGFLVVGIGFLYLVLRFNNDDWL